MKQVMQEGLDLAQQLVALPFKAARQAFQESELRKRPVGEVIEDSLSLTERLSVLPLKAAAAVLKDLTERRPDLEARVSELERRVSLPSPPTDQP